MILLKITSPSFKISCGLSFQVMTMLMGEYDFTLNFVANPNSSYMAKVRRCLFYVLVIFSMLYVRHSPTHLKESYLK